MSEVLSGIKVLDFGQYVAGPYTAMLLAEQGADVLKVERPGGEPYRSKNEFVVYNRSKRSITLDLRTDEGKKIAHQLAAKSDVIIENYRPGIAERLGIGYDSIRLLNPGIIYCSISGFGRKGPYKDLPGWEPLVLSMSTLYTGQNRVGDPVYQNLLVASHYASFLASFYIVMAIYTREMTGRGDRIDLSLLKSVVAMQPNLLGNTPTKISLSGAIRGFMPLVRAYQGSDKLWFVMNAPGSAYFTALCSALGHEEWLIDPMFDGAPYLILPPRNAQVVARIQSVFYTKTRDEWVSILRDVSVPAAPVNSIEQFMQHPHLAINNFMVEIDEGQLGNVKQSNIPVGLSEMPGSIKGPSPSPGQHTQEVLSGLGYSASEIESLRRNKVV